MRAIVNTLAAVRVLAPVCRQCQGSSWSGCPPQKVKHRLVEAEFVPRAIQFVLPHWGHITSPEALQPSWVPPYFV